MYVIYIHFQKNNFSENDKNICIQLTVIDHLLYFSICDQLIFFGGQKPATEATRNVGPPEENSDLGKIEKWFESTLKSFSPQQIFRSGLHFLIHTIMFLKQEEALLRSDELSGG